MILSRILEIPGVVGVLPVKSKADPVNYTAFSTDEPEINLQTLTADDFDSLVDCEIVDGALVATTEGVIGTATITFPTIDRTEPFHLAVETYFSGTANSDNTIQLRIGGTDFRNQTRVNCPDASGNASENSYGWGAASYPMEVGYHTIAVIGDGVYWNATICKSDRDLDDVGASNNFFHGPAMTEAQSAKWTTEYEQTAGFVQLANWTQIQIRTESRVNKITRIALNRGGWGGFGFTRARIVAGLDSVDDFPIVFLPDNLSMSTPVNVLDLHHPNTGSPGNVNTWYSGKDFFNAGWVVAAGWGSNGVTGKNNFDADQYEANNWGADYDDGSGDGYTALDFRTDLLDYTNRLNVRGRMSLGQSMGGLNCLRLYSADSSEYDAIALVSAVTSIDTAYNTDGFSTNLNGAWGTAAYTGTALETNDPHNNLSDYDCPIVARYSTADAILDQTAHAATFEPVGGITRYELGSGAHLDSSVLDGAVLLSWWNSNFGS